MSAYNIVEEWLRYGVTVRYPDELVPDENMVKIAIKEAQQVYNFCKLKIRVV